MNDWQEALKKAIKPRNSISSRLNPRVRKVFQSADQISKQAQQNLSHLHKLHDSALDRSESGQALVREYDALTVDLVNLARDLEVLNLAQDVSNKKASELTSMLAIVLGNFQEEALMSEEFRQDVAHLSTLITNFKVFLNDPGELAALLDEVDPKVRDEALKMVRRNG